MFYSAAMGIYGVGAMVRAAVRRTGRPMRSYFDIGEIPVGSPSIWIHAVSVGETKAIAPLAKRMMEELPGVRLVVSSVTGTGHAEAKRSIPGATHIYLPLDLPGVMKRAVAKVKPDLFLLSETDYWPTLFQAVKASGARIAVVNGKLSERSARGHRRLSWLRKKTIDCVDTFCLQSEIYRERFEALGVPKEKLLVTGNLKFDTQPKTPSELNLELEGRVLTIGSTHDPEERQLLSVLRPLIDDGLRVLLVPRHPQRFDEVAKLVAGTGHKWGRYSEGVQGDEQVVVVDAMGLLLQLYQLSDVALVAGSWTPKIGGHNLLEPIHFGVPTLFGPHMFSQADMADLVLEHKAGLQVSMEEVAEGVRKALQQPASLREGGAELLAAMQGSVDRTWQSVKPLVAKAGG